MSMHTVRQQYLVGQVSVHLRLLVVLDLPESALMQ
jgi:hypothetical protein